MEYLGKPRSMQLYQDSPERDESNYSEGKRSFLYRKPAAICEAQETLPLFALDSKDYIEANKESIRKRVSDLGLSIGKISCNDDDFQGILDFLKRRYPKKLASEICEFDLFRFVEYGHALILKDTRSQVVGTVFEMGYDTPEKTSYTIRLAIDANWSGRNLGVSVMKYSCLLAMEKGALVKRGLIQFENLASLYINLNKVGWICNDFIYNVPGLGPFFKIVLPLDPPGMMNNIISQEKCLNFIHENQPGRDYHLIKTNNLDAVNDLYRTTDFKIVAVIKAGQITDSPYFFALRSSDLGLNKPENTKPSPSSKYLNQ